MSTTLTLPTPRDYVFERDVCSYGYFLLAPNRWDPARRTLTRTLRLEDGRARFVIGQPRDDGSPRRGAPVRARADRALSRREQTQARRLLTRSLRIDEDAPVRSFHRVDPRWKRSGRARLFRSPTLFEDLIKTVTSCNVAWPSTVRMNARLCDAIDPAFPAPAALARRRPQTLRSRCGVGYRDARIVDLAKLARDPTGGRGGAPAIDQRWLEDPATTDADAHAFLLSLPGIGPYAAANVMQLLGRYGFLAIDTESVRHGRDVLGLPGDDRSIIRALIDRYEPFGEHRFRSYWFELWDDYERRHGPAWTWEPKTTGLAFTAAKLRADADPRSARTRREARRTDRNTDAARSR